MQQGRDIQAKALRSGDDNDKRRITVGAVWSE
jgi:hypothetical protein